MEAVSKDALLEAWPIYGPIIEEALFRDYEGFTIEDVKARVDEGSMLGILMLDGEDVEALATLELITLNGESVCHVLTLTGRNIEKWLSSFVEGLKEIARTHGCKAVTLKGRPGWRKLLKGEAEELFTVMRCQL